jgi:hypothetical protein
MTHKSNFLKFQIYQRTTLISAQHLLALNDMYQPRTENKVRCHYHSFASLAILIVWFNPFGHNVLFDGS